MRITFATIDEVARISSRLVAFLSLEEGAGASNRGALSVEGSLPNIRRGIIFRCTIERNLRVGPGTETRNRGRDVDPRMESR